jgi:hypothetical protein
MSINKKMSKRINREAQSVLMKNPWKFDSEVPVHRAVEMIEARMIGDWDEFRKDPQYRADLHQLALNGIRRKQTYALAKFLNNAEEVKDLRPDGGFTRTNLELTGVLSQYRITRSIAKPLEVRIDYLPLKMGYLYVMKMSVDFHLDHSAVSEHLVVPDVEVGGI